MNPIVLAAFPGLLFTLHPPTSTPTKAPATITVEQTTTAIDSCSTYIYKSNNSSTLYYNGQAISPELLNKLGPLAAPLRYGLSQENVG